MSSELKGFVINIEVKDKRNFTTIKSRTKEVLITKISSFSCVKIWLFSGFEN